MANNQPLKTVLIADHDDELTSFLTNQFRAIGMEVWTAANTNSAVRIMDEGFPDLIVLDIELPAGNGRTFLEILGLMKESRSIPAIVLCDADNWAAIDRSNNVMAYYAIKNTESWQKIKTFTHELVDLDPNPANSKNSTN